MCLFFAFLCSTAALYIMFRIGERVRAPDSAEVGAERGGEYKYGKTYGMMMDLNDLKLMMVTSIIC